MDTTQNTPKLAIAMNYINDNLISGAIDYVPTQKKAKATWFRHVIVAACLCLVNVCALTISNLQNNPQEDSDYTASYYSLSETEHLCVKIIEVGSFTYKAKVVDSGNNSVYSLEEEVVICVNFQETEILLSTGRYFNDTVDDINDVSLRLENIGWDVGSILYVEFDAYTDNNRLFASYIEATK